MTTVVDQIIRGQTPDLDAYLSEGLEINDIDEYGFTLLIESAIAQNVEAMRLLLARGSLVNEPDVTGRTALHWSVDHHHLEQTQMLLEASANPNAYTRGGQPPLVYPLLREQEKMKALLYTHGADLNFAQDFIQAKLIGHRFELKGEVEILNAERTFITLDYEGFFLEFSVDAILHSLQRFSQHFSFQELNHEYGRATSALLEAIKRASQLLKYQGTTWQVARFEGQIDALLQASFQIFPIASQGHALTFVRLGRFWAKCDRGENSLKEGTVNIYEIGAPEKLTLAFLKNLIYKKQTPSFIQKNINTLLALRPIAQLPLTAQISGNCSWANVEGAIPTACALFLHAIQKIPFPKAISYAMHFHEAWIKWDKDRALEACVQSFEDASAARRASKAATLGAILFQSCRYQSEGDMKRAEKILKILMLKPYRYILDSYVTAYCADKLTQKGNNLLQILDDFGINPDAGVSPIGIG